MGIQSPPKTTSVGTRVNSARSQTLRQAAPPVYKPTKPAPVSKPRFEPNPALAAVQAKMKRGPAPRSAPPPVYNPSTTQVSQMRFKPNPTLAAVQAKMKGGLAPRHAPPPAFRPSAPASASLPRFESKAVPSGIQAKMAKNQAPAGASPAVFILPGAALVRPSTIQLSKKRKKVAMGSAPGLNAKEVQGKKAKQEGYCGNFKRVRNWKVVTSTAGVIVQEVERIFNVTKVGGGPLTGVALDAYVKDPGSNVNATETKYWELWTVDSSGNVSDGSNDTFGLCSIIPWDGTTTLDVSTDVKDTTRGSFKMTGKAQFYETNELPKDIGFPGAPVKSAGGLLSTTVDPTGALAAKGAKAVGSLVNYDVTVTWDSSNSHRYYSKVTAVLS